MSDPALIQIGSIGAPFGVRGWVKLRSFTEPAARLLEHRSLHVGREGAWRVYRVEESGRSGGQLTAKFEGIRDRDQAIGLRGAEICVLRAELPARAENDYYRADLLGCEVVNMSEASFGTVQHFIETPAHAFMVVRGEQEYWIPALPQYLRRVDLKLRRIVVDWNSGPT